MDMECKTGPCGKLGGWEDSHSTLMNRRKVLHPATLLDPSGLRTHSVFLCVRCVFFALCFSVLCFFTLCRFYFHLNSLLFKSTFKHCLRKLHAIICCRVWYTNAGVLDPGPMASTDRPRMFNHQINTTPPQDIQIYKLRSKNARNQIRTKDQILSDKNCLSEWDIPSETAINWRKKHRRNQGVPVSYTHLTLPTKRIV